MFCVSWMPKTLHNSPPQEIVETVDLSFNEVYHFYIFSYFDKRGIRNNEVHLSGMDVWETQKGGNQLKKLRKWYGNLSVYTGFHKSFLPIFHAFGSHVFYKASSK